ncbi:hypothetical protein THAOC_00612, partial [Thalassiosira oceanica]
QRLDTQQRLPGHATHWHNATDGHTTVQQIAGTQRMVTQPQRMDTQRMDATDGHATDGNGWTRNGWTRNGWKRMETQRMETQRMHVGHAVDGHATDGHATDVHAVLHQRVPRHVSTPHPQCPQDCSDCESVKQRPDAETGRGRPSTFASRTETPQRLRAKPSINDRPRPEDFVITSTMSLTNRQQPISTSAAAAPGLLQQVGMAGSAAVITVSFIHPSML